MSDVLLLPQIMNLDMYLEMRMITVRYLTRDSGLQLLTQVSGILQLMGRRCQAVHVPFGSHRSYECCSNRSVYDERHESLEHE